MLSWLQVRLEEDLTYTTETVLELLPDHQATMGFTTISSSRALFTIMIN
jgi:hypothetical protein